MIQKGFLPGLQGNPWSLGRKYLQVRDEMTMSLGALRRVLGYETYDAFLAEWKKLSPFERTQIRSGVEDNTWNYEVRVK